jgi:hypothetical protein
MLTVYIIFLHINYKYLCERLNYNYIIYCHIFSDMSKETAKLVFQKSSQDKRAEMWDNNQTSGKSFTVEIILLLK